jgi:microcompartment protein CcmK/EutM
MLLARIDGVIVSTVCHPSLQGCRTVICQPLNEHGAADGAPVLALDAHGAGQHQRVLVSSDGAAARAMVGDPRSPLRNTVIAILDDAS